MGALQKFLGLIPQLDPRPCEVRKGVTPQFLRESLWKFLEDVEYYYFRTLRLYLGDQRICRRRRELPIVYRQKNSAPRDTLPLRVVRTRSLHRTNSSAMRIHQNLNGLPRYGLIQTLRFQVRCTIPRSKALRIVSVRPAPQRLEDAARMDLHRSSAIPSDASF